MNGATTANVENRVHRIFLERLELDVGVETEVIESGVMDSLVFVQLLVELEDEFGVEVDIAELELGDFASVAHIAKYVTTHQNHSS